MKRTLILATVLALIFTMFQTSVAQADWIEYKSSPRDTDNRTIVTPAYDISSVDFAFGYEDNSSDPYYRFWIDFKEPVKADLFADDSSWAAIMIDADNDGEIDYSVETHRTNIYEKRYAHEGRFIDRRTPALLEIPSCDPQTWSDTENSVTWIGFRFLKDCVPFSKTFAVQGYSDRIGNDQADYDYAPESLWAITPGTPESSGPFDSTSSSVTSSSDLDRTQLAGFALYSSIKTIVAPASAPRNLIAITPNISPSVVTVLCADGSGTGWSIDVNLTTSMLGAGYKSMVITNHHVIEDCLASKQVTLVLASQRRVSGLIWAWSSDDDTAGILTKEPIPTLPWRGATPQQGWWVGVFGSPLGLPGVLTTGIVSSVNVAKKTLTMTAPLNPGNSGGPVFDNEGRVIGLATAKYRDSEGFGIVHGTPLLCNKILNCSDPNQVWVSDLSLIKENDEVAQIAESKVRAETELRLKEDMRNRCVRLNGDLQLAIFNAKSAAVAYPSSSSTFTGIVAIAPPEMNCDNVNVSTFDSEFQSRQKILATLEIAITNGIAVAQASALKKQTRITCVKGKSTKKLTGVKSKCPKGYRRK